MKKTIPLFASAELEGKTIPELHALLTGKVMACSKCCGDRVVLTTVSQEDTDGIHVYVYYGITCGGISTAGKIGCCHNFFARSLAEAINAWNMEIAEELECFGELDFATEIVFA